MSPCTTADIIRLQSISASELKADWFILISSLQARLPTNSSPVELQSCQRFEAFAENPRVPNKSRARAALTLAQERILARNCRVIHSGARARGVFIAPRSGDEQSDLVTRSQRTCPPRTVKRRNLRARAAATTRRCRDRSPRASGVQPASGPSVNQRRSAAAASRNEEAEVA